MWRVFGGNPTTEEVKIMFEDNDIDNDGAFTFEEFVHFMVPPLPPPLPLLCTPPCTDRAAAGSGGELACAARLRIGVTLCGVWAGAGAGGDSVTDMPPWSVRAYSGLRATDPADARCVWSADPAPCTRPAVPPMPSVPLMPPTTRTAHRETPVARARAIVHMRWRPRPRWRCPIDQCHHPAHGPASGPLQRACLLCAARCCAPGCAVMRAPTPLTCAHGARGCALHRAQTRRTASSRSSTRT